MKKDKNLPYHYDSLFELHRILGLPKPQHPLVSLINNEHNKLVAGKIQSLRTSAFYKISFKSNLNGKLKYGQHYYDFEDGGMFFVAPNQVTESSDSNGDFSGYTLIVHPDFLLTYPLAKKIKQFGFFSYTTNEALHLSTGEKEIIIPIFQNIEKELQNRIDDFSQDVIISQIETLLNYSNRFYKRQFITRKAVNNDLLEKFEAFLERDFQEKQLLLHGMPTVQLMAERLNLSSSYLSDMLRAITGQSAQHHIHHKLIEIAKEKLSSTNSSISEIAYELGFEHPQSFSRLFKQKTRQSPVEFRAGFN
ncbi:AraC family transcriptional regulator [Flavobacterium suaedae]|uniref:AraC family transcriptional regulator n=1 Tax=Flavobacterium suaedae TaxID=1767027 RepID=A0ABQ1K1C8_9FLAO|nr:AraC family transcriptional regulator [Flavobacterium suaedae]GGB83174.1 AraC family transcriptional regulator [Flavobacterium suaedae]